MQDNICVSIICNTYNHEKYIAHALESFLMQKTDFSFEILVHDDASTDSTPDIIKTYAEKYPDIIKPILQTENQFSKGINVTQVFQYSRAKGKYIAFCEGDDYWIDSLKLQKQVDFLEANADFAVHCHNFKTQNGSIVRAESHFDTLNPATEMTISDLSKNNIIPTLTAVFRNQELLFPDWTLQSPLGDIILFLQVVKNGKIKYLNEKMAVYRQNVGVWSGKKMDQQKMIYLFENLADEYKDLPQVRQNLLSNKNRHVKALLKEMKISKILVNHYFKKLSFTEKANCGIPR